MNAGRWIRPRTWSFIPSFTSLPAWWSLQRPIELTRLRGPVRQPAPIGINWWVLSEDAKIVQRTPFASEPAHAQAVAPTIR